QGVPVLAITSCIWSNMNFPDPGLTDNTTYLVQTQGIYTGSFSAGAPLGFPTPTALIDINIDKTPPTITGSLDRPPDSNGWYASNVTARFVCSDALSGIASCPPSVVLSTEGANQSVTGTTMDRAGNSSSTT